MSCARIACGPVIVIPLKTQAFVAKRARSRSCVATMTRSGDQRVNATLPIATALDIDRRRSTCRSAAEADAPARQEARIAEHFELGACARTICVHAAAIRLLLRCRHRRAQRSARRDAARACHSRPSARDRDASAQSARVRAPARDRNLADNTRRSPRTARPWLRFPALAARARRRRCACASELAPLRVWRQRSCLRPGPSANAHAQSPHVRVAIAMQRKAAGVQRARRAPQRRFIRERSHRVRRHVPWPTMPPRALRPSARCERAATRLAPSSVAGSAPSASGSARQRIPVRAVIGRHRHQPAQAVAIGERSLHAMARVLAHEIAFAFVAQAPVRRAHRVVAAHQRVAQLVKDDLRQRIVGVEVRARA